MFHETLYAFYDFRVSPVSFDVMTFLVLAERVRRYKGLEKIHVVIISPSKERRMLYEKEHPGADIPHETLYNADHIRWRLSNIIVSGCRLLPSVQDVTVCDDGNLPEWILSRAKENVFPEGYTLEHPLPAIHTAPVVIASNLGQSFQFLEASPQARQYARQWLDARANGRKCVPITLREAHFTPEDNSDLTIWAEIAQRLQAAGYFPFILRDIDKALDNHPPEFKGISSCPEAVFNLELRTALYEESHICAFVSNGPVHICYFNRNIRYLVIETGLDVDDDPPQMNRIGIGVGRTPPFANHFQKWLWDGQDADIFMDEFVALDILIEQSWADGSYESKLDPDAENIEPMEFLAKRFYLFSKAHCLVYDHDYSFVLECLKHISSDGIENPDTQMILADAQFRIGVLARQNGDITKAIRNFQFSIENGYIDQQVYIELGGLLEKLEQPNMALNCYKTAMDRGVINKKIVNRIALIKSTIN